MVSMIRRAYMNNFQRKEIDQKAVRIVSSIKCSEMELIQTLQQVESLRIFQDFGFTSLFAYCTERLGLSEDRACTYIGVARLSKEIPTVKTAIERNELSISNARKLFKVITPQNEKAWLETAKHSSTRELQVLIATERPEEKVKESVKPIAESLFELRCSLSSNGEKLLTRALDLLSSKERKSLSRGEALEAVLEDFIKRHDPVKKAERALSRKEIKLPVARRVVQKGKRTAIPAAVGHVVVQQTQGQCTYRDFRGNRCSNRRWVDKHHVLEVSHGGTHTAENLTVLCSAHHRMVHKGPAFSHFFSSAIFSPRQRSHFRC